MTAKETAWKYMRFQLRGLKEYKDEYPQWKSLINLKEDKIKGAFEMANTLGLMTYEEYAALRKSYGV